MAAREQTLQQNNAELQLQAFIDKGEYAPGDRLPAERQLTDSLGISRTSLRKGLDALERKGTIWRHVGKGTFVSGNENNSTNNKLANVDKLTLQITPVQMMRARFALEPAIAREAAANASYEAVQQIRDAHNRAVTANSWEDYEQCDHDFHRTVAESTGNVMLSSLYDHLSQVQRTVTWHQVVRDTERPSKGHKSFAQHDLILNAIIARDPVAAHLAMREHLNSVSNRLFGEILP